MIQTTKLIPPQKVNILISKWLKIRVQPNKCSRVLNQITVAGRVAKLRISLVELLTKGYR